MYEGISIWSDHQVSPQLLLVKIKIPREYSQELLRVAYKSCPRTPESGGH